MLGKKHREFKTQLVSLEMLVPQDNFYRQLEAEVDLSFVHDLVKTFYSSNMGRPSIDAIVFFKLQLIMFFEGIRSERQLMEISSMRLDHRWYIGYDLDEKLPCHSSLSKIRTRYGLIVFQRFFEKIVELCIEAGLVQGKELYLDGTSVVANADHEKRVPRFYWDAQTHLQQLFEQQSPNESNNEPETKQKDRHFVHKYDGHQRLCIKSASYHRQADYWVNTTDPDATPLGKATVGYHTNYVVDGGKSRIIMVCLTTPASIPDNAPMLDLAWWARFRWQLPLQFAVGDQKYGTIANIVGLESNGIKAYVPLHAEKAGDKKDIFPRSAFFYDIERDRYICPRGAVLHLRRSEDKTQTHCYYADIEVCNACSVKKQCTKSKRWRQITHSYFKRYLDRVLAYQQTDAYKKAMRKRQVWVEPKFAESKLWHRGRRFRLRGIHKVNIEALLRASVQNIRQLLLRRRIKPPLKPVNVQAMAVPVPLLPVFFAISLGSCLAIGDMHLNL